MRSDCIKQKVERGRYSVHALSDGLLKTRKLLLMRVLVTGHRGYVGAVLVGVLRHSGFDVAGADLELFQDCDFGRVRDDIPSFPCDVGELAPADLASFDAVVHLAWQPDDTPCLASHVLEENVRSTLRLAESCREARVARFVFVSTWQVYGRCLGRNCDEGADADRSDTARGKRRAEQRLRSLVEAPFRPVIVRAAECYGVSPRLRLDQMVNRWTAQAVTSGAVHVEGDGRSWRPLIHVEDLARACAAIVSAPDDSLVHDVLNVAAPDQNLRLREIADTVAEATRSVRRLYEREDHHQHPDARLDVGRFLRAFPRFQFRWSLERGVAQLRDAMMHAGLTPADLRTDRFDRCRRFLALIDSGRIAVPRAGGTPQPVAVV